MIDSGEDPRSASGVLARCARPDGTFDYFVVRRSALCHQGSTWAVPGGALNRREEPLAGALREFAEEVGVDLAEFAVVAVHEDDHGGWTYTTVVVEVTERFAASSLNWETDAADWVAGHRLAELELLAAFRATLARLGVVPPPLG